MKLLITGYFHKISCHVSICFALFWLVDNIFLITYFILPNFIDFRRAIFVLPYSKCGLNPAFFFSLFFFFTQLYTFLLPFSCSQPIRSDISFHSQKKKTSVRVWFSHCQFNKSCIYIFPDIRNWMVVLLNFFYISSLFIADFSVLHY